MSAPRLAAALSSLALLAGCGALLGDLTERASGAAPTDGAVVDDAGTTSDALPQNDAADPAPGIDAACVAEPLAVTCKSKACGPATNDCGVVVACPDTCTDGAVCGGGGPDVCGPASCVGGGSGVSTCGPTGTTSCCASSLVLGTTYNRAPGGSPATVSTFRLDDYEVTVGRFRKFVAAALAGYRPPAASGRHSHLGSGGLNGGSETGWNALEWNAFLPATAVEWAETLNCGNGYQTFTPAPGANEKKPQNCASWYTLYAFCIWDGGFLPTEAEWQLAATAAGTRTYPWAGGAQPGANADLGAWGCFFDGTGTCSGAANIAPVGAIAAGVGAYGHFDLGGNMYEWALDGQPEPYGDCRDCAHLPAGSPATRTMRGGSFQGDFQLMQGAARNVESARGAFPYVGARCARKP